MKAPSRLETEVFTTIEIFRIFMYLSEFLFIVLPLVSLQFLRAAVRSILLLR